MYAKHLAQILTNHKNLGNTNHDYYIVTGVHTHVCVSMYMTYTCICVPVSITVCTHACVHMSESPILLYKRVCVCVCAYKVLERTRKGGEGKNRENRVREMGRH